MPTIRTFIAVDISENSRRALSELHGDLSGIDAAVKWVDVRQIHLTLKFLGSTDTAMVPDIRDALREIGARTPPISVQPAGCGAFPTINRMRVVWVGLRGDLEALGALRRELETAMIPFGFEAEDRPFRPHLTLGRVKGRRNLQPLQEAILERQGFEAEPFNISEIVLYKSELRPEGAHYSVLYRAPAAGLPRT